MDPQSPKLYRIYLFSYKGNYSIKDTRSKYQDHIKMRSSPSKVGIRWSAREILKTIFHTNPTLVLCIVSISVLTQAI